MHDALVDLTADQLLAIPESRSEKAFGADATLLRQRYRALAGRWHPDRAGDGDAGKVFQHLTRLYRAAEQRRDQGVWEFGGRLTLRCVEGREFRFRFRRAHEIELGHMYVGDRHVCFLIRKSDADLFRSARQVIQTFPCATPDMAAEVNRYLPQVARQFETPGWLVLVLAKREDLLCLADVLEHLGGCMDPRHVAWVMSSLLSLACYLQYAGLTHNAITPESYFISPPDHTGALLGGWWFAALEGARLKALPAATLKYGPYGLGSRKRAEFRTDLELIRALGRQLLGPSLTATGTRVPREMTSWLQLPATASAMDEYSSWQQQVLEEGFGGRRFVPLSLTADALYGARAPG